MRPIGPNPGNGCRWPSYLKFELLARSEVRRTRRGWRTINAVQGSSLIIKIESARRTRIKIRVDSVKNLFNRNILTDWPSIMMDSTENPLLKWLIREDRSMKSTKSQSNRQRLGHIFFDGLFLHNLLCKTHSFPPFFLIHLDWFNPGDRIFLDWTEVHSFSCSISQRRLSASR